MTLSSKLKEIASVFFKLGCIAFGGPAAHVALMQEEVIEKRQWISQEHFLDLMGATHLIPGPNSTEMTMHCGLQRAGALGLFVAGSCFIFPATIITLTLAWCYTEYGQLPEVHPFIQGIKPSVLVIIAAAIYKLGKKALKNYELYIIGLLVLLASLLGISEITLLLIGGILGALYFYTKDFYKTKNFTVAPFPIFGLLQLAYSTTNIKILLTFLKVGAILYGSGYVLFAYLDDILVSEGLLSRQELIDAIAVGQFTPGPVLSTATFIGYQLGGVSGALMATMGIFLPSFLFVLLLNPLVPKMRQSRFLSYFLDSVNIAAVAVMVAVVLEMSKDVLIDWKSFTILLASIIITFVLKKQAMWCVLSGAILGYLLSLI